MKKKFKYTKEQEAWLRDLEKTRAKQGRRALHTDSGYCCLGRGCIVLKRLGHDVRHEDFIGMISRYRAYGLGPRGAYDDNVLSNGLRKLLGLSKRSMCECAKMNDAETMSFKQIAKRIREAPHKFFTRRKGKK